MRNTFCALALLATSVTLTGPAAAQVPEGGWEIKELPGTGRVQLVFFLSRNGMAGTSYAFDPSMFRGLDASLYHGLTAAQKASSLKTATRFEIIREAGIFACEGYFEAGIGRGTFVFQPNLDFRGQMLALGFRDVAFSTVSQLMLMAIHDVTGDFASAVRQLYPSASVADLIRIRDQGVGPKSTQ